MVDIKRIDDRAHDGISTGNIRIIVDDRDPQAEIVRSVVGMADFADKRHPFPGREVTTKGYPAFENCNETFGHGGQRPMGASAYYFLVAELVSSICPG